MAYRKSGSSVWSIPEEWHSTTMHTRVASKLLPGVPPSCLLILNSLQGNRTFHPRLSLRSENVIPQGILHPAFLYSTSHLCVSSFFFVSDIRPLALIPHPLSPPHTPPTHPPKTQGRCHLGLLCMPPTVDSTRLCSIASHAHQGARNSRRH
jgi:hypothetical protein